MVYLIADAGATKTDWCLAQDGKPVLRLKTAGISPVYQTEEEIECSIRNELLPSLNGQQPQAIYFYGAGCATPALTEKVCGALQHCLCPEGNMEVCSDMVGAARALLRNREGIACILGTGSNSCMWDGHRIVMNVPPLGYILGDEGSGAYLGKQLVGDLLKGVTSPVLLQAFNDRYGLTQADIIDHVYRRPFPNRFLASLSPFLAEHTDDPDVRRIVQDSFCAFLHRNVLRYPHSTEHTVCFTGSVAWHYRSHLTEVAHGLGIHMGSIVPSPMEGLVVYHNK